MLLVTVTYQNLCMPRSASTPEEMWQRRNTYFITSAVVLDIKLEILTSLLENCRVDVQIYK